MLCFVCAMSVMPEMFVSCWQIVETIVKIKLPEDLHSALHDGVILCHLANHLRPHSVSSVHVPSPSVVMTSEYCCIITVCIM